MWPFKKPTPPMVWPPVDLVKEYEIVEDEPGKFSSWLMAPYEDAAGNKYKGTWLQCLATLDDARQAVIDHDRSVKAALAREEAMKGYPRRVEHLLPSDFEGRK